MNVGALIVCILCLVTIVSLMVVIGINYPIYSCLKLNNRRLRRTNEPWRIPKVIYRVYAYGKGKKLPEQYQKAWDFTAKYNPEFKQVLFDDKDCEAFLKKYYSGPVYEAYHKINPKYGAARADLFRYALMYEKGGIYLDVKSAAKSLCKLVSPHDGYILSPWPFPKSNVNVKTGFGEFAIWHIICRPKHPFLKAVLDQVVYNINHDKGQKGKVGVLYITGPFVYTTTIIKENGKTGEYMIVGGGLNGLVYPTLEGKNSHKGLAHYSYVNENVVLNKS